MSSDDFQTKYASVMESMLKSAIAETTKLYETMVDELKEEISKFKKENEDLKTRCTQYEIAKSQPVGQTRERDPAAEQSDALEKCDTAVQCDLVPCRTVLVEQCQPLRHSALQNQEQQYTSERMDYSLQEHNYVSYRDRNSKALVLVKQEESCSDSSLQCVLKQEEIEPPVASGQFFSNDSDSEEASLSRAENKGSMIIQECSAEEINSPQKDVETQLLLNLPCLRGSQNTQYQSSGPHHSLVISLKDALREDIKEEWEGGQKLAEMQEEPTVSEKQKLVPEECHHDDAASINEQTEVIVPQHADVRCTEEELAKSMLVNNEVTDEFVKDAVIQGEGSPKLNLSSRRRRGRPPKKRRQKEILLMSTEVPKGPEGINAPSVRVEGTEVSPAVSSSKSLEASPAEPLETSSIITSTVHESCKMGEVGSPPVSVESLSSRFSSEMPTPAECRTLSKEVEEDATDAQSNGGSTVSQTPNSTQAELLQVVSGPLKEHHTSVRLQDAMLLVEAMNQTTVEKTASLPQSTEQPKTQLAPLVGTLEAVTEIPAVMQTRAPPAETLLTAKTQDVAPRSASATSSSYAQAENKVVVPIQQFALAPLLGGGSSTIRSMMLSAAATQPTQHSLPHPLITLGAPTTTPRTIIIVPRPVQSFTCHNVTGVSSPMCSIITSTAAQNNLLPPSTVAKLPLGPQPLSSVSRKTIKVTYNKLLPIQPLQATTISTGESSETSPHQKITISPRPVSAEELAKPETISLTAEQGAAEPAAPAPVGSLTWMETHDSSPSFFDENILSDKLDGTTEYIDSSKQTTSVSETDTFATEACSSSEMSVGQGPTPLSSSLPSSADLKLNPVVRLQRLSFPVSTKESVFVSRLSEGFSDCITQNSSKPTISHSGMPVSSSVNPLCVSEIPEGSSISEDSPISRDVQPYLLSSVSETVLVKPPVASNTTVPSPEPTSVSEVIPNLNQEIISSVVQENQADGLLRSTFIPSKDMCDPHLQMTKTQFLAQLSVSPVVQALDKESSTNNSADVSETRTSRRKRLQKNAIVARLRSHLKTHFEAKRTEIEETDAEMVPAAKSSKKPRLEKDSLINESSAKETACSTKSDKTENITPDTISRTTSSVSRKRPRLSQDVSVTTTVGQSASVDSSTSESTRDSTAVSFGEPGSATDCVGKNILNSTFLSPRQFNSTKESTRPKKIKLASVSPSRSSSDRVNVSSRNKRSSSVEDGVSLKMTRDDSTPQSKKSTSPCPKRLMRDVTGPKKTQSPCVGLRKSTLSRNGTSPKMSGTSKSSTFIKVSRYNKSIKRESNSFSPGRYSLSTVGDITESTKNMKSPKTPGGSTPAKKLGPIQGRPALKTNFKVANALKLAKAAKAKRRPKRKKSNKLKRQKRPLAENQVNQEVKKCRAKVWYPPTLPPNEVPSTEIRRPPPVIVEDKVPLIPFNESPIVSPLQPLAVIGKHLLRNQCGQCGRMFSSSPALESHVSLHAGHQPFSCTLCGKSFPDSKSFKRHDRVHRNGRIHVCRHCGKGFVYRFGLTKHQQMVHGRIKPFVCQICSKGFFTKRDVEIHIRIHTGEKPFPCHLCEKKFTRRVELNVHLRWHNGEKRHWCPYCGKGFLDYNNLKRHKYTHTGEKPYHCTHCPKKFTQTGHLKKHMRNVHHDG